MTCRDFVDFVLDYVEGALPADTRQRFHEHMARCPDCVTYLRHYAETIKASRIAVADAPSTDIPEALVSAILNARER